MAPPFVVDAFKVLKGEGAKGDPAKDVPNRNKAGRITSWDRGCYQINNQFHPEVSNAQAHDPVFSAIKALEIYKGRGNWSAWCSADKMGLGKSC